MWEQSALADFLDDGRDAAANVGLGATRVASAGGAAGGGADMGIGFPGAGAVMRALVAGGARDAVVARRPRCELRLHMHGPVITAVT